ncbi:MAG: metallophosphoesterase [Clostridia bacterium]|nr:metallophosphoesterase [Clostridia bacterium]
MPRIAIISDSHGSIENAYLFRDRIGQVDALYHLGDHADDAPQLAQILNCGYVAVRGNCDPFSDAPLTETVEWDGTRILLLHGHTVSGRLPLRLLAQQERADFVLFGHSHVPSIETVDGVLLINPGSLSRPRTLKGPSMAVLTLRGCERSARLFWL